MRRSGGEPVPAEARAPFEQAYGYALDPVRLHRGPVAARAAASLGAHAVALGDHILLGTGADVSSHAGRMILGHELAHVVQARRHPMAGIGRVSRASDASEVEATSAALRALRGESTDLVESASDDPQLLAWWVLALIGLGIGAVVAGTAAATGHGVDENRAAHTHANRGTGQDVLAWIPIAGSVQDIWEAESNLQLAFGIGFLAFDCATLGGTGMLVRGLARVPGAALRVLAAGGERAAAESAAHGVLRVAGEEVTEQALQQATHQLAERGGAVSAATATEEISRALARDGAMVFATEGAHAVMYANRAGQIVKVHGGPLIVRVTSELGENAAEVATRAVSGAESREGAMTAYVVLEGGAPLTLQALERMPTGVAGIAEAAGRNIVGSPTSCGILQGAALEASGLSAEAAARLIPSGGGSGRYFPVTLVDHWITSGEGRLIEGGAAQLLYGADRNGAAGRVRVDARGRGPQCGASRRPPHRHGRRSTRPRDRRNVRACQRVDRRSVGTHPRRCRDRRDPCSAARADPRVDAADARDPRRPGKPAPAGRDVGGDRRVDRAVRAAHRDRRTQRGVSPSARPRARS